MTPKRPVLKLVTPELQEKIDAARERASHVVTIDLFGEEFDVTTDVNAWLLTKLSSGDLGAIVQLFEGMLVREADNPDLTKEERAEAEMRDADNARRLDDVLSRQRGLDTEVLTGLLKGVIESAADRPTK